MVNVGDRFQDCEAVVTVLDIFGDQVLLEIDTAEDEETLSMEEMLNQIRLGDLVPINRK